MVPYLDWIRETQCQQPVVIAAWEGWGDAGSAASIAVHELTTALDAELVAQFDPEPFYVFSDVRPSVTQALDGRHEIDWPTVSVWHGVTPTGTDLLIVSGPEPQLSWRTFCNEMIALAIGQRARLILTLGSVLADIPHTRDTPVYGNALLPRVKDALSLDEPRYDGRADIHSVLHVACASRNVNSASLWGVVPAYVSATPSPKAALALLERLLELLGCKIDLAEMRVLALDYEDEVGSAVSDDSETLDYVARLEELYDERRLVDETGSHLVEQIERFLREH